MANKFQKLRALYRQEGLSKGFWTGCIAGMNRIGSRTMLRLRRRFSRSSPAAYAAHRVFFNRPVPDGGKVLYLTFDTEWKKPENLALVLDTLQERGVHATFFLLGEGLADHAELVRRIRAEGHAVGNHTMTHPALTDCSRRTIRQELRQCADQYRAITGEDLPKIMRPPFGKIDLRTVRCLHRMGYGTYLWNMHVFDWKKDAPATWEVFRAYLETDLKNGAIILQHTFSDETAAHMGKYIDYCLAKGYRFALL